MNFTSESMLEYEKQLKINPTPAEKLVLLTIEHFRSIPKQCADLAIDTSKKLLKDQTLVNSNEPEMLVLKQNLTKFVNKYNSPTEAQATKILDKYEHLINAYYAEPKDVRSKETQFIVDLLDKYEAKDVFTKGNLYMEEFLGKFDKMFQEYKQGFEKPILDWYVKFQEGNLQQKIALIIDFMFLIKLYTNME